MTPSLALFALVLTALCVPIQGYTASFDCAKASSRIEKLICGDAGISTLDESLARAYTASLHAASDPARVRQEQKAWLRQRDACQNVDGLRASYETRLTEFRLAEASVGTPPRPDEASGTAAPPLTLVAPITHFRPVDYPIRPDGGRLYFSQYDQSGNNVDILAFDIADQSATYVLRGRPGAQFVAQSDKYLVVSERGRLVNPLVVIERATGKRLKELRLQLGVSWGRIEGDRLLAVQGPRWGGGTAPTTPALIFELPSLKVLKSTNILGSGEVHWWQGAILSLGYNVTAYDGEFNELFKITFPARITGEPYSCGTTGPMRVYQDKAVIVANCGELWIYDLPTRQLERTIPAYAHSYSVAILDGLIFTAPTGDPRPKDSAHVYDLASGRELAVLPINATELFAKGDRLLAVEREFAKPSPMSLYAVNAAALRSGEWRTAHVRAACRQAEEQLARASDLYSAIDMCKAAGIEGLVAETPLSPTLLPVLKQYALWLSRTLDRGRDAIRMLERVASHRPDSEIESALADVRLKARVLHGDEVGDLTPTERRTPFAQLLSQASDLTGGVTKTIDFGSFSELFHFSGDRVYVGRYGSRRCSDGGASIGVLDRTTFDELGCVPIAPDDAEYQDNITSIASDEQRLYVSVGYRYEQAGRPNFFVVDKQTQAVVTRAHVPMGGTLIYDGDRLLACGCHFTTDQRCQGVDPTAMTVTEAPGARCVQNERGSNALLSASALPDSSPLFAANTRDYVLAHTAGTRDGTPYALYLKAGGPPSAIRQGAGDGLRWPASVTDNTIVFTEASRSGRLVKLLDASTGQIRTVFGLPTARSRVPIVTLPGQSLLVGLGRDLLVFDLASHRLQRYVKDFIPARGKEDGRRLDPYQIGRLMVDRDRLIALTFRGENSRIAPLAAVAVVGR